MYWVESPFQSSNSFLNEDEFYRYNVKKFDDTVIWFKNNQQKKKKKKGNLKFYKQIFFNNKC